MRKQRNQRRQYQKKDKTVKIKVVRCMKHLKPVMSNEKCDDFLPMSTFNTIKQCMFCKYKN